MNLKFFFIILLFLVNVFASPVNNRQPSQQEDLIISEAKESWDSFYDQLIYWKFEDNRISYRCFEPKANDDVVEMNCVCRGPQMYNTHNDADDSYFKFRKFNYEENDTKKSLREKAQKNCKPVGVICC